MTHLSSQLLKCLKSKEKYQKQENDTKIDNRYRICN